MGRLFSLDNPVMTFLSKLFDVMCLSLLWLIFCLPVVTIGASTTALYYTSVKSIRRDRGYIVREFWHCFKTNFLQSTILWIAMVFLMVLMSANIRWATGITGTVGAILAGIYVMITFLLLGINVYMFPVLSRFTLKILGLLKICLFMMFRHLPSTILLMILFVASVFGVIILPILIIIIPAAICLLMSMLMERILKKYTPEPEKKYNEEGELLDDSVPWYLE